MIVILAHAPRFITPIEQTIKAVAGKTVVLDCTVNAAPLAKTKWLDKKDRLVEPMGKIKVLSEQYSYFTSCETAAFFSDIR